MSKTDKELAVELACSAMIAAAVKSNAPKPIDANFIHAILYDCYESVSSLPPKKEHKSEQVQL